MTRPAPKASVSNGHGHTNGGHAGGKEKLFVRKLLLISERNDAFLDAESTRLGISASEYVRRILDRENERLSGPEVRAQ